MGLEKIAEWCLWRIAEKIQNDIDPERKYNYVWVAIKRGFLGRKKYYIVVEGDLSAEDIDEIESWGFKLKKELINERGEVEYWFEV